MVQSGIELKEQDWHRSFAWMVVAGATYEEAAKQLKQPVDTCRLVGQQPFFRALVARLADEAGQDAMRNLIAGQAVATVLRLVDLRDQSGSDAVRLGACKELLDRYLGKAPQAVELKDNRSKLSPQEEARRLEQEIAELGEQLKSQGREQLVEPAVGNEPSASSDTSAPQASPVKDPSLNF